MRMGLAFAALSSGGTTTNGVNATARAASGGRVIGGVPACARSS